MSDLQVIQADITKLKVDAIVNAANRTLLGGGGVDGAIHRAAGPELLVECRTLHGCDTGEAKITKGYNLPAKYVIHTVDPVYNPNFAQQNAELLVSCYKNSLNLAKEYDLHSIAFSCISTGVYGYPKVDAAKIAVETTRSWLKQQKFNIKVYFCVFDSENKAIYNKLTS
ncbi:O-acetyl-ADP-ribose deacetylase [Lactobacillus taiwanensis]|uniref:O-acetyl-ADP-ribose deacetylase n=1 Tax=Lactobacillus taiwanensis TaxID=508451 RepID=UPI000B995261|nr:O-acetyl-ADP-ribose deacetylase [Lactobacillus taiwanensis]OYS17154.1 O-acetyl-ADP-ribose deacetylase [Lactobacillus taiwanensis]OYS17664.1 O-acetyl-ADP-ribose deacetylase [Lactobacillus taiwanensis]